MDMIEDGLEPFDSEEEPMGHSNDVTHTVR